MRKKLELTVGENCCRRIKFRRRKPPFYIENGDMDINLIRNSRIGLIIVNEEIFTYTVKIPLLSIFFLDKIIVNNLEKRFMIKDCLLFDYKVIKIERNIVIVRIFSINGKNLITDREELFERSKINYVEIKQFIWIKYLNKKISIKDYMAVVFDDCCIYIIVVDNGCFVKGKIITIYNTTDEVFKDSMMDMNYAGVVYVYRGRLLGPYKMEDLIYGNEIWIFSSMVSEEEK